MQRTSSDLRLNPHLHIVFLDGVYRELGEGVVFEALEHLATSEVGEVLEKAQKRMARALRRRGLLESEDDEESRESESLSALAASAVSGAPPTGPTFLRKLPRLDMDPLSLLTRLCAAVPPPRVHTVRYAGVLAAGSKLRARIVPKPVVVATGSEVEDVESAASGCRYWRWSELLKRSFDIDLRCATCGVPMKLVALVQEEESVVRFLRALREPTERPRREPARGPPWWRSSAVRRLSLSDA